MHSVIVIIDWHETKGREVFLKNDKYAKCLSGREREKWWGKSPRVLISLRDNNYLSDYNATLICAFVEQELNLKEWVFASFNPMFPLQTQLGKMLIMTHLKQ